MYYQTFGARVVFFLHRILSPDLRSLIVGMLKEAIFFSFVGWMHGIIRNSCHRNRRQDWFCWRYWKALMVPPS